MKYFKFVGDQYSGHPFKTNEVYKGSYKADEWAKVSNLAIFDSENWIKVPKPKKTIHDRIEKLKKRAEKEGMKLVIEFGQEVNQNWSEPTFTATNPKDQLANRVKERVKVKNWSYRTYEKDGQNYHECTLIVPVKEFSDDVHIFLTSKLEEYLNS